MPPVFGKEMEASYAAHTSVSVAVCVYLFAKTSVMKRYGKLIVTLSLVLVTALAAGCGTKSGPTSNNGSTGPALFKVIDQKGKSTNVSMNDLKALPLTTITIAL
jgi:hypothetical protein